eukprot:4708308-Amphidinium_carterae.1
MFSIGQNHSEVLCPIHYGVQKMQTWSQRYKVLYPNSCRDVATDSTKKKLRERDSTKVGWELFLCFFVHFVHFCDLPAFRVVQRAQGIPGTSRCLGQAGHGCLVCDVDAGRITAADLRGNGQVDVLANQGTAAHGLLEPEVIWTS